MTVIDRVTVRCRSCGNEQQAAGDAGGFECGECGTAWRVHRCRACRRASIVLTGTTSCPRCGAEHGLGRPTPAVPAAGGKVIGGSIVPGAQVPTLEPADPTPAVPTLDPVVMASSAVAPVVVEPVEALAHKPLDLIPDAEIPLPVLVADALWKLSRLREQGMIDEDEVHLLRDQVLGVLLPAALGPADDALPTKAPRPEPRVGRLRRRRDAKTARAAATTSS